MQQQLGGVGGAPDNLFKATALTDRGLNSNFGLQEGIHETHLDDYRVRDVARSCK